VGEEELLGAHGARRVDDDAQLLVPRPAAEGGRDIVEERGAELASAIAVGPEEPLEGLEGRVLDILGDEVLDVGSEGGGGGGVPGLKLDLVGG
jgi:hypothetical protein